MKATYRITNANGARFTNSKDGWYFSMSSTGASWRNRSTASEYFKAAHLANGGKQIFLRIEPDNGTPATVEPVTA